MKKLIRQWLGYPKLESELRLIKETLITLQDDIVIPLNSIASLLMDENSASRQELSNKLAAKVLKTLEGEEWARRHTTGET